MKKLLVLAVLAVALIATPAMAKEGPYLGIGLTHVNIVSSDSYFDKFDTATGLEFRFGYSFGSIALEGNYIGSTHNISTFGWTDADFRATSIDLRVSFSQEHDPTQVYLLVGLGAYSIELTNLSLGQQHEITGGGFNLGAGFEHFFNEQVSLDFRGVYRSITFDQDINGIQTATGADGDTFTLGAGLNLHF